MQHDGHVLVVEDEPALRIDLVDYLLARGFRVDQAATCRDSLALLERSKPDLILLDLALPDGSGLAVAAAARQRYDLAVGIIMLTAFGDEAHRLAGRGVGADIYLVKDTSLREIEACCRNLLRRLQPSPSANATSPPTAWHLDDMLWQLLTPDGSVVPLTATEVAFLKLLMAAPHIAQKRADLSPGGEPRNLDAVVLRLRRKIEAVSSHPPPFKAVYGSGYVFTGAPPQS
ncbi:response regulator transcription factor [Hyphomicrobium sp. DMF-1]|jgi:DNA-binding response OmpR family regulator|uniref:response regulator transcription factor n=1 Tax=Hyphomicrobium sp. DMF-1 TaxID=3019544 RepID=UPI0022EBB455|nr:response regulator transcription factor [Hyphomicrobium sp. DMF-1]WBT39548.1 response regulator transcription factor [Hyphomicrobium sp. DMF-1]